MYENLTSIVAKKGAITLGSNTINYIDGNTFTVTDGEVTYKVEHEPLTHTTTLSVLINGNYSPLYKKVESADGLTVTETYYNDNEKYSEQTKYNNYGQVIEKGNASYVYSSTDGESQYAKQLAAVYHDNGVCVTYDSYVDSNGNSIKQAQYANGERKLNVVGLESGLTQYLYDENDVFLVENKYERSVIVSPRIFGTEVKYNGSRQEDVTRTYSYDSYGRIIRKEYIDVEYSQNDFIENIVYGTTTTTDIPVVKSIHYSSNNSADDLWQRYTYDTKGNLTNIAETYNGTDTTITYTYDSADRLTSEVNAKMGVNRQYAYSNGRISAVTGNGVQYYFYERGRLQKICSTSSGIGELITYSYDSYGNRIGKNETGGFSHIYNWTKGTQLSQYVKSDGTVINYTYDGHGVRARKEIGGVLHRYIYADNQIMSEYRGTDRIHYIYDHTGLIGFNYNGITYGYVKNALGDIIAITKDFVIKARYVYDAWGNHKVLNRDGTENTSSTFIGNINPLRYRGYYYDKDLKLYYLINRYYDPEIGQFISPDSAQYLDPTTIDGVDLYAYCRNNPVMYVDNNGNMPEWIIGLGRIFTGIGAVVAGVMIFASSVALAPMLVVATITIVAGTLTIINGVADIQQSITGENFVRDGVFGGNESVYNTYAGITEGIAIVGSYICGRWLKVNKPRIQAFKGIERYTQTKTVAGHIDRAYNNSLLLQKEIIKYGKMSKDLQTATGYIFTAPGTFNGANNVWRLVVSNIEQLILHFGF